MEAASVVVFPFVQCELVAPLVVDGSPDTKSSCSVGVNGFTGSGFTCICSEELVLVLCGARIGGHCGWPQCLGPAPVFRAGYSVWGRLQCLGPAPVFGAGSSVWGRLQCLGPAPVFGAGSSVWGRLQCLGPAPVFGAGSSVWSQLQGLGPAPVFGAGSSVWGRLQCLGPAPVFGAGSSVWGRLQCLGPAPVFGAGSSVWGRLQFKVPLHMLGSTFVTTPFNPGNVAAGSSPVGSLTTPYVRGVLGVGGWAGGLVVWRLRVLLSRGWPGPRIQLAVKDTNWSKGGYNRQKYRM